MCRAEFLSTLSLRRATGAVVDVIAEVGISIHALLAESDAALLAVHHVSDNFYPRSPCGERPGGQRIQHVDSAISIHALLAESDDRAYAEYDNLLRFLSTLSLRRATVLTGGSSFDNGNFYPRSPCGERLNSSYGALEGASISIHALLAESDFNSFSLNINGPLFLSTLSLRRATNMNKSLNLKLEDFYPRSPCGERQRSDIAFYYRKNFYPRSPCGERRPST